MLLYYLNFLLLLFPKKVTTDDPSSLVILKCKENFIVGKKLTTAIENKPYAAFWKIPYAEPPVKELRFKPPQKLESWIDDITYDYSKPYNDTCSSGLTEDCLYLSLFTPLPEKLTNNLAVIVWIHEHSNLHEPDFLIDEEVIIVAVSYRTSILGFLDTGDDFAEGNMGAKDVLMALKWVKDNIAIFNGDINKVTIVGSGSSAAVVASCLVSNAAEDLFDRAIIQSGSALSPADYSTYSFEKLTKLCWKIKGLLNIGWDSLGLNYAGATAGDEICYLFKCKSVNDVYRSAEASNERQFIKKMAKLWANFAKYGNPTPDASDSTLGSLKWEPLQRCGKLRGLSLGKKIKMVTVPEQKRVNFWDGLKEEFFKETTSLMKIHDEL